MCTDQSACYVYGHGSWAEGINHCHRVHPNARMIEETSDEQRQKHIAEAGAYIALIKNVFIAVYVYVRRL